MAPLWIVQAIKAIASQLIVWHHFVAYGPMSETLYPHSEGLFDWLYDDARLAVQAFLVVGGFLSARSLAPDLKAHTFNPSSRQVIQIAWRRYLRLVRPFVVALLLAIAFSALARALITDPDTPAAPSLYQLIVHFFLAQDILGFPALSAGVWYVAIDLQLFCTLLLLLWTTNWLASAFGAHARSASLILVVGLASLSIIWFNRDQSLDKWGIYFFGAYALGVMVQWSNGLARKHFWLAVLCTSTALGLALEWRSRLVVALVIALILGLGQHIKFKSNPSAGGMLAWLSRISYEVFLLHYPIVLLVGTLIAYLQPNSASYALFGLLAAWALTMGVATLLHQRLRAAR